MPPPLRVTGAENLGHSQSLDRNEGTLVPLFAVLQ